MPQIRPRGHVTVRVTDGNKAGKVYLIEALVPSRITSNILGSPVPSGQIWKHLVGLQLADPDYGTPKAVDLLIGTGVFSCVVLHIEQFRPTRSLSSFKTQFGWVLAGTASDCCHNRDTGGSCYLVTTLEDAQGSDELLRKFWEIENHTSKSPCSRLMRKK